MLYELFLLQGVANRAWKKVTGGLKHVTNNDQYSKKRRPIFRENKFYYSLRIVFSSHLELFNRRLGACGSPGSRFRI
jgi:hypothetical protein